ncbi:MULTISPECIES: type II toxin-antitoxin system RelE/ParE family toxin [Phyllobacteriaceae]|uniref:type II toxin-antitoxin system RelE/ParE family toxin n=1 Tax=Mesorhizobium sp. NBIMC_P2-C2 TaxID=1320557 RepID=UPI0009DD70A7|nr:MULTISPECIES: type II toxin-antitoxin system RelE/ParE family toxin [unclassified Mesorhizobium]MBN9236168.1 type II toxin-antitoxin system RelE/ParE family toxin [Mesorhizobium sp.]
MIGFRDDGLQAFFVDDVRSRCTAPDFEVRLFCKLQMIDDAVTDQDWCLPPSNHVEKLRGNLVVNWQLRTNTVLPRQQRGSYVGSLFLTKRHRLSRRFEATKRRL